MHDVDLILTLTGGLSAALVLGYATQRLGLSPIVGYLLAGMLVGPHTPGFVANREIAEQFAEVGIILLMFGVGLQLHVDELLAVRRVAVPGAVVQSAAAAGLGAMIGRLAGWSWTGSIVFGLSLSVASTVVLIRILSEHRDLHTTSGHIAVGWLVVEDLLTVVALVLLPALVGVRDGGGNVAIALGTTALKIGALVAIAVVIGNRAIPRALDYVAATRSRELFTLTVLVLALGIAVGSAAWFGVSMPLGAFVAGLIVGRSEYSLRAASEALPMRDAFAVLFFVAVGMLLEPAVLIQSPGLIAAALAVVLVGKPIVAFAIVRLLAHPPRVALSIAVALAQIGEFSFILTNIGRDFGILPREAINTVVIVAIVSIVVNPLLYRAVAPLDRWAAARPRRWAFINPPALVTSTTAPAIGGADARNRAVVIGYGPTGRTVTRLLRENGIAPTIVELNVDTVRALKREGIAAVYGDARQRETLQGADVAGASSLVLASAGMDDAAAVIQTARSLNPRLRVLARATYLRELPDLRRAGADTVIAAESEIALAFVVDILQRIGATPDQIDRERARAHTELLERTPG